jgi:predicted nuclease of restriction endonuclease-like RecB superfamily
MTLILNKFLSHIDQAPWWAQVILLLLAIAASVAIVVFIIGSLLGATKITIDAFFKALGSIFNWSIAFPVALLSPAINWLYRKSCEHRKLAVQTHYEKQKRIKQDNLPVISVSKPVESLSEVDVSIKTPESTALWEKFPPNNRTTDGHLVRSRAEVIIDDWLFHNKILHVYEKRLPFPERTYCDFYIPECDVYIEYWGLETKQYLDKKRWKQRMYSEYNLCLIEIEENDLKDIDHFMTEYLSKYGFQNGSNGYI